MSEDQLRALLPEWQKRLRLQDWDIKLAVHQNKHDGRLGRMANSSKYHAAIVDVVIDPASDFPVNLDPEVSLVHELLHVQGGHLTEFLTKKKNRRYYDDMERLVELTAIALVSLKRQATQQKQAA